jgi:hypothetical protein
LYQKRCIKAKTIVIATSVSPSKVAIPILLGNAYDIAGLVKKVKIIATEKNQEKILKNHTLNTKPLKKRRTIELANKAALKTKIGSKVDLFNLINKSL